jgi:hypothetical protein
MADGKLIRVLFAEADSGASLGWSEMPAEQLPDSFEARTTLHLNDGDWEVVTAEPMTRSGYQLTGELHLTLRKITIGTIHPSKVLFSLPTICDEVPGVASGTSKLGRKVLELHEDDWRQIELVALSHQLQIDNCLAAVRQVYAEQRTADGFFKGLHVRNEVARPLEDCRLSLQAFLNYFPSLTLLEGLAYRYVAGLIEGGFACAAPSGLQLYGVEKAGSVTALGLLPAKVGPCVELEGHALARLMRDHGLSLVDWCRAWQVHGSDGEVAEYFKSLQTG